MTNSSVNVLMVAYAFHYDTFTDVQTFLRIYHHWQFLTSFSSHTFKLYKFVRLSLLTTIVIRSLWNAWNNNTVRQLTHYFFHINL